MEHNAEGGYSDVGVDDSKVLDIPCNESTCEICLNSISNLRQLPGNSDKVLLSIFLRYYFQWGKSPTRDISFEKFPCHIFCFCLFLLGFNFILSGSFSV